MMDFTGYNPEAEDKFFISSLTSGEEVLQLVGAYSEQSLDPRKLIRVENQKSMGSCAGHSLSSNLEWLYCISTQGQVVQLSRMAGYILAQDRDGIRTDSGSVVSSGFKVAFETGLPEESLWPYPSSYNRTKPGNDWQRNAEKYRIAKAVNITSWDQWKTWLGSGQGGIHTGISWGNSMNKAVVDSFSPGGGGHSIAALGLSERKDRNGDALLPVASPCTVICYPMGKGNLARPYRKRKQADRRNICWCLWRNRARKAFDRIHNCETRRGGFAPFRENCGAMPADCQ